MKESTLTVTEFKAKCLRLLDELAANGHRLIITKRGRPIARIEPVFPTRKRVWGSWKGLVKIKGDIVYFDTSKDWESNF